MSIKPLEEVRKLKLQSNKKSDHRRDVEFVLKEMRTNEPLNKIYCLIAQDLEVKFREVLLSKV